MAIDTTHSNLYSDKEATYFSGGRKDIIDSLSEDPNRKILEIGCGEGSTGAYAKKTGKCGLYVGIELFQGAADIAATRIDQVYVGDVERFELPESVMFNALIASEVLEHLVDPWKVLQRLRLHLSSGAIVCASSPNVAHYSMVLMLLRGGWDLAERGRMDRTHLRWFTPKTYAQMFIDCGYEVVSVAALAKPGWKAKLLSNLTSGASDYLTISQVNLRAIRP